MAIAFRTLVPATFYCLCIMGVNILFQSTQFHDIIRPRVDKIPQDGPVVDETSSHTAASGVEADELYSNEMQGQPSKYFNHISKRVNCPALWKNATIDESRDREKVEHSIPDHMLDAFTYGGRVNLRPGDILNQVYLGGHALEDVWTEARIENMKTECGKGLLPGNYGVDETNWLREGLHIVPSLYNSSVLVIGSENPWVEACILSAGAAHVTTLEYGEIVSSHPRVKTITPANMRMQFDSFSESFDVVVTVSSVEHAGLGRYGDALNPYGDRQAIARAWCATKDGGYLVIGVPIGSDTIEYNAHRVYGPVMFPHLVANWEQLWQAPSGFNRIHVLQKPRLHPEQWLCISGGPFGRTGNQLNAVGYGLWYARDKGWAGLQILTDCSSNLGACMSFNEWKLEIEIPGELVFTSTGTCAETKSWETVYFEQYWIRGDVRWAPPLPALHIRVQAEQAWSVAKVRASAHGRSFEGQCAKTAPYVCPSRVQKPEYDMCDYSKPNLERQPGFLDARLQLEASMELRLFTDHQNSAMDNTFPVIDEHPFMVQLWMMVLSHVHFGIPGSSLDYLVWMWKQKIGQTGTMFPLDCYTHFHAHASLPLIAQADNPEADPCTACVDASNFAQRFSRAEFLQVCKERRKWYNDIPSILNALPLPEPHTHSRFDHLGPVGPPCLQIESYGSGDEEKRACGLSGLRSSDCVVVSLGSNNMWGFEEAIHQRTSCRIEVFDCTIAPDTRPPAHIMDRTTFHHVCIGDEDAVINGQQFLAWRSITKLLDLTVAPAHLKMDIEGYEYDVLRTIMKDGVLVPSQIAFELHYETQMPGLSWRGKLLATSVMVDFMQFMYDNGYYMIDKKDNPFCPHCSEILVSRFGC